MSLAFVKSGMETAGDVMVTMHDGVHVRTGSWTGPPRGKDGFKSRN